MHGPGEVAIGLAGAHQVAQRDRRSVGQARAEIALRGEADPVAARAELVADRADEADPAPAPVGGLEVASGALARVELRGAADLTVALARAADLCSSLTGEVTLAANVCNRGTNPVPDGARVIFYEGDPDGGAEVACERALPILLDVGACTEVTCQWTIPDEPGMERAARSVTVVVDPDGDVFECRDANNRGVIPDIICGGLI